MAPAPVRDVEIGFIRAQHHRVWRDAARDRKDKFAACDPKALDPKNPNCDNYKPEPINGRIVKSTIDGSTVEIWFAPCASRGIDTGWKGKVMRGSSGQPLSGGEFTVTAVSKNECRAKVRLSQDTVSANLNVRVSPP